MLSSDAKFVTYQDAEVIRLYWHRFDRLETFKKQNAPSSAMKLQEKLVKQARRVLHSRGIEDPPRPEEPMRPPVTDKAEASQLFKQGSFGNYVQQWNTAEEAKASGYTGLLVLRYSGRGGGGKVLYDLSVEDAIKLSADPKTSYFNEQLNDKHKRVTIQGEVMRDVGGLYLMYSCENMPMRPAMADHARHARGIVALELIRHFCCPRGYECITELLEEYPGHVIEFTCFDRSCGALGWNTIVWEVRAY